MKTYTKLFLIFSLLLCGKAMAQSDLAGTWQGKLTIDQNTKMTIHFILTRKADGSYTAVLNSPDTGGIKNVAASSVKYAGGKLSGNRIDGTWTQSKQDIPLSLTKEQPAAAPKK